MKDSKTVIKFNNIIQEAPFILFKEKYDEALNAGQNSIEAVSISSYCNKQKEVDSRYVNLKYVVSDEFIFFSNYNSPKAHAFSCHKQIAALFFWPKINTQIRMKAYIKQTSHEYNQKYFYERSPKKNALAISSNQSNEIDSFDQVVENYNRTLMSHDLQKCPNYWGGFSFTPYYFEFWEGNHNRLNKRKLFKLEANKNWKEAILEP